VGAGAEALAQGFSNVDPDLSAGHLAMAIRAHARTRYASGGCARLESRASPRSYRRKVREQR